MKRIRHSFYRLSMIVNVVLLMIASQHVLAQTPRYPFPQYTGYTSGTIKPTNATQSQLDDSTRAFYNVWKAKYLRADCGLNQYYVFYNAEGGEATPNGICVSEGQGYGMLITAIMAGYDPNARTYFDGLYNFYKAHPSEINHNLMAWNQIVGCVSTPDSNSATDGDLDIGYALLLADKQWGSNGPIHYLQTARDIINAALQDETNPITHATKLGDWANSADPFYYGTRTSDFMPNHFRAFAAVTGDPTWSDVVDECYSLISIMQTNHSAVTGLLPDFIRNVNTTPVPAPAHYLESAYDGHYNYNACRDPWRIATDYLISGDPRALTALNKMNTWLRSSTSNNPDNIHPGYFLNGNPIATDYQSNAFNAPFAVGAMVNADNQAWLNALYTKILATDPNSEGYYENSLKMLSMIVLSGNWWNPQVERTIAFSGYNWIVKSSSGKVGPGPNYFSDSTGNVWVDAQGELHVKITKRNNKWYCSEVLLDHSLGYGNYVFHVAGGVGRIDSNVVLGLFTWDDNPAQNNREIDIEFSRWGDAGDTMNSQYTVQPYTHAGNYARWRTPPLLDTSTHSFNWQSGKVSFAGLKGKESFAPHDSLIYSWNYTGADIPSPGNESPHINFWLMNGLAPTDSNEVELVITKFEFNPLPSLPSAPVLISPLNNTVLQVSVGELLWSSSAGSTAYHLQVAADSLFNTLFVNDSTLTDTSRSVGSLISGTSYYWRVRASNSGGSSPWTNTRHFSYVNPNKWKLISVPFKINDPRKSTLFPTALSNAFAYLPGNGYTIHDSLYPGLGYWLKFGSDETANIVGDSILIDTIDVSSGWNLIGSVSSPVAVISIGSIPSAITTSNIFGYGNSYTVVDSVRPGRGYWIKVSQDGKLILSSSSGIAPVNRIIIIPTAELPPSAPGESVEAGKHLPAAFSLEQNYPNPFNTNTNFRFSILDFGFVALKVFDVLGREVATLVDKKLNPGYYQISWDADNMPSGVYFYRLEAVNVADPSHAFVKVRKMLLMR